MARELSEAQFLKDVSDHKIEVLEDNGVFRCVRFAVNGSWNMHFILTTWPDYLCVTGDMGTFVFTRIEDMFRFFRTPPDKAELYINPGYWGEKCESEDRRTNGMRHYSEEVFKERIGYFFDQHEFDNEQQRADCWQDIKHEVLCAENEQEAHRLAGEFKFEDFEFSDFWESDLRSWSYHFLWCCYAITWGIRQYDRAKEAAASVAADAPQVL